MKRHGVPFAGKNKTSRKEGLGERRRCKIPSVRALKQPLGETPSKEAATKAAEVK